MPIPTFGDKYDEPAFMSPEDRLTQRFGDESTKPDVPDGIIVTLQEYLFNHVADRDNAVEINLGTSVYSGYVLGDRAPDIGVIGDFGIGGPTLGIVIEELIALGATQFLIVGGCGTLQPYVSPGDAIIVDEAIRDEGTSYHYIEPATTVSATPQLVTALKQQAANANVETHVGKTWTTDAFYRETRAEIDHYEVNDVLTVEMEAATLFAISKFRNVVAGAILAPFDRLTDDTWTWDVADVEPKERLQDVFEIGLEALKATHEI